MPQLAIVPVGLDSRGRRVWIFISVGKRSETVERRRGLRAIRIRIVRQSGVGRLRSASCFVCLTLDPVVVVQGDPAQDDDQYGSSQNNEAPHTPATVLVGP